MMNGKNRIHYIFFVLVILLSAYACAEEGKNVAISPSKGNDNVSVGTEKNNPVLLDSTLNIGRLAWQKPDMVIGLLGDISEKTVVDIGAMTGYFSFRLAFKAKKVIAVELDTLMIQLIETFKLNLPLEFQQRLETRYGMMESPNLRDGEADVAFISNTIGYFNNRTLYFENLKKGLADNGILMIVDFKNKRLPFQGPPKEYIVPLNVLEDELIHSGYRIFRSDDQSLDYQYIVMAYKN